MNDTEVRPAVASMAGGSGAAAVRQEVNGVPLLPGWRRLRIRLIRVSAEPRVRRDERRRRALERLGLSDPPPEDESLRRAAHFLRHRESRVLWAIYSVMLGGGLLVMAVGVFVGLHNDVTRAVAAAHTTGDPEAVHVADASGLQMLSLTVRMAVAVILVVLVWLSFIWAWYAFSMRFGGRDRNLGLATRALLLALKRPHWRSVLSRRRLLESTRRWAACARRAGLLEATTDSIVDLAASGRCRTRAGTAHLRRELQELAMRYDTGELLDARMVMQQRSRTWAQIGTFFGGLTVAAVPPAVAAVLAMYT
jgi:hypothetical protein